MPDPRRDTKALTKLMRYLAEPRTLSEIQDRFSLSWRSAYRWIDYLKESGLNVVTQRKDKEVRFFIVK